MAELKRNFLKAKMNKDLDERLVDNGEYRDALNVEIASSEGAEVGSVQTLKGNHAWFNQSAFSKSENAQTVGYYNDREKNHVYNFVCDALTPLPTEINTTFGTQVVNLGVRSDLIEQITPHKTNENLTICKAVIHDVYEVYIRPGTPDDVSTDTIYDLKATNFTLDENSFNTTYVDLAKIRPGMRVQAIDLSGEDIYGSQNEVIVKEIVPNGLLNSYNIKTTSVYGSGIFLWSSSMSDQGVVLKFSAPRILKFRKGNSKEKETNVAGNPITFTPTNSYISAINVIDDFLMWTDSRNEPKKINIKRSLAGNATWGNVGALASVPHTMLTIEKNNKIFPVCYLEESHTTVLKPNPETRLTSNEINIASNTVANIPIYGKPGGSQQPWGPWNFTNDSGTLYHSTTNIYIQPQVDLPEPWLGGTVLSLTGFSTATNILVQVKSVNGSNPSANNGGYYTVTRISDYPDGYDNASPNEVWTAQVVTKEKLYSNDFISFSYRYIYSDGEASCLAPFTTASFLPGDYAYSPKEGYNLGMQSAKEQIELKDFIHYHTPKDVSIIQLIFKSQKSDNLFVFQEIDRLANAVSNNVILGSQEYDNTAQYDISSLTVKERLFGHTLPSDQITRTFDAVPKKAVAQEVQANRLMYANFTQDYDLIDSFNNKIIPSVSSYINSESAGFGASFSSNATLYATQGIHYSGTVSTNPSTQGEPIFVRNAERYQMSKLAQGYYTTQAIKMGVENDPGNNFQAGNTFSVYTAPTSGFYKVKASARIRGFFETSDIRRPRTVRLAILPTYPTNANNWTDVFENAGVDSDGVLTQFYSTDNGSFGIVGYSNNEANNYSQQQNTYIYYNYSGGFDLSNTQAGVFSQWLSFESMQAAGVEFTSNENNGTTSYFVVDPTVEGTGITSSFYTVEIPETEIFLEQGDSIALYAQSDEINSSSYPANYDVKVQFATFEVTEAPATTFNLPSLKGQKSIKSDRNYNVGVVYRDSLGRESSVLVGKDEDFSCEKSKASNRNSLLFSIKNNYPTWAETYKYFIKENTSKYNNLVLEAAFVPTGQVDVGDYIYLVFNSIEKDKVKVGDYLIAKKQQNTNTPITSLDDRWRVISIIGEATVDGDTVTVEGNNVPNSVVADNSELDGKFFVKVFRDNIDGEGTVLGVLNNDGAILSVGSNNGAVFETEPDNKLDLDLYYEIGDALPIRLDKKNASKHIKIGSIVTAHGITNNVGNLKEDHNSNPRVIRIEGSITKGVAQYSNFDDDYYCKVFLDKPATQVVTNFFGINVIRFRTSDRSYTEAMLGRDINIGDDVIYLLPQVHYNAGNQYSNLYLTTAVDWYNCISFGNGVESDTIRDDFNGTELFKYIASGKQSGVKASIPITNYSEYTKPNDIIFSEIYNENRSLNRFNEFIIGNNIIKQINPDYGSIQKLFSRNNDLVTICEKKCLRVLSQKDALFNADGKEQLLATDKVLGQAIPFAGDYGISKNPESFAFDEYRCYFTDTQRGAVVRLSMDGITPISRVGMDDWFSDHLVQAQAIIGSFDSDKEEYNITIHEVNQPGLTKEVYTLSFNEDIDGWTSFKSFIKEAGLTLNNKYYTFKSGLLYRHHDDTNGYNNFYGVNYNSSITALFNDNVSIVKTFRYLDYEGTQARVIQDLQDSNYYNINSKDGWYAEYLNTDLQESLPTYFLDKEGKWFSYIRGVETKHTNLADGGQEEDSNIDTKEFSVQGLGNLNSNVTLISGTLPSQGFNVNVNVNFEYDSQEEGVSLPNLSSPQIGGSGSGGSGIGSGGY